MPSSQLKRAEKAIAVIREASELPPEAADVMEELIKALRIVDRRLAAIERGGHKLPTTQMEHKGC
jgi:hypothetical protein